MIFRLKIQKKTLQKIRQIFLPSVSTSKYLLSSKEVSLLPDNFSCICEFGFKVITAEGVLWAQAPSVVGKPLKCDQIFKISYGFKSLLYKPINIAKKV